MALTPILASRFSLRLLEIDLGDILLQAGASAPALLLGRLPPDRAGIMVPLGAGERNAYCGSPIQCRLILVCGAGAECEIAGLDGEHWVMMTLTAELLARLGLAADAPIRCAGAATVCKLPAGRWGALVRLTRDALGVARRSPTVFSEEEACRSLRADLRDALLDIMDNGGGTGPPAISQAPAPQRRLVHAVADMLEADPGASTDVLAALAGATCLEVRGAFHAVLRVSPDRFLLRRRLVMAHAAFVEPRSVPDHLALTYGFRDGAAFRRAYHAFFGGAPMVRT